MKTLIQSLGILGTFSFLAFMAGLTIWCYNAGGISYGICAVIVELMFFYVFKWIGFFKVKQ